jgi:hypothetical protein
VQINNTLKQPEGQKDHKGKKITKDNGNKTTMNQHLLIQWNQKPSWVSRGFSPHLCEKSRKISIQQKWNLNPKLAEERNNKSSRKAKEKAVTQNIGFLRKANKLDKLLARLAKK